MHYMQYFKLLFVLAITVVLVWLSIVDYNLWGSSDPKMPTFRQAARQHERTPVLALFVWVATGITLFVTLLFEFYMLRAHSSLKSQEMSEEREGLTGRQQLGEMATWASHKNGNVALMLKHVAYAQASILSTLRTRTCAEK